MEKKEIKFNAREQALISSLLVGTKKEIVTNNLSKQSCELEPLGVALYDYINGTKLMIDQPMAVSSKRTLIGLFDLARGIFRKLYPGEYMILLD